MKEVAKLLGLKEEATEEEIVAKIKEDQTEKENLKKTNESLVETNKTLAVSEAGKQARIDELEKSYKEVLEKGQETEKQEPKSDIEKLAEMN